VSRSHDLIVVGGGPVGWACALAAAASGAPAGLRVAVVDRATLPSMPSGMIDTRVYAMTADHLNWLETLGVSLDAARTCDVETIRVFDQAGSNALTVDMRDSRSSRLASIVEHDALTQAIATRARALGVQFVAGEAKQSGTLDNTRYVELGDGQLANARLVIVADGARSTLRDALGVQVLRRDYERCGVVAHFAIDAPHRGEARQWFLPEQSILALLPLPDITGAAAVSMVWSTTSEHSQWLLAASESELCNAVTKATGSRVRALSRLAPCRSFPLSLARVADPVAERALVVGDAAHAVHPLAGQGVNLGLGDAEALADLLNSIEQVAGDVGHPLLLAKFRRSRYAAVLAMQAATDGLARIYNLDTSYFANSPTATAAIGDLGMRVLGKLPAFRRLVSSVAG
jgi:2-polyprenylphenol 6-hydroxylase